jgi:lipoyl(octanoyl) transferase
MDFCDLNIIDFEEGYALQERLAHEVLTCSKPETLLLLEHPPVYTIGRRGDEKNVLDRSIEILRINRGGDVTFHGPGQLVGYPIFNLSRRGRDVHLFMRFLEEVLILTAADFGVEAYRVRGRTGVWTDRGKLASLGVGIRRWVTMHGFAMNALASSLAGFERINPCGIRRCPVTSLAHESVGSISLNEVKSRILANFRPLLSEWLPFQ